MNILQPPRTVSSVLLTLGRLSLGIIFLAHGLQKLFSYGIAGTAESFAAMGVPAPALSAWFAALVETIGGAALLLGLLTPIFALLLAVDMFGALILVHLPNGLWASNNGYELVLALAAGALTLAATGAGPLSIDAVLTRRASRAAAGQVEAARA